MLCDHVKTGTYFVMHLVVAVAVAFAFTGDIIAAMAIGLAEPLVQTFCYHFHEKYWDKVKLAKAQV